MSESEVVALVDAPRLCGVPYRRLWVAVVNGVIPGERRGGQWFVFLAEAKKLAGTSKPVE